MYIACASLCPGIRPGSSGLSGRPERGELTIRKRRQTMTDRMDPGRILDGLIYGSLNPRPTSRFGKELCS